MNTASLHGLLIYDGRLPHPIFCMPFDRYLFFDADVCTSNEFVQVLQTIASECYSSDDWVEVFAASDRSHLARLSAHENWADSIDKIARNLRGKGDYAGLVLVAASQAWIAIQSRPVDIGVFAFNDVDNLGVRVPAVADCFFGCNDISEWLSGGTQRDVALQESFGTDFLSGIVKNYCKKNVE